MYYILFNQRVTPEVVPDEGNYKKIVNDDTVRRRVS